tara:strand:- start:75634 stop:76794 length:1161 start_codon:yes stop_codon:yes gene_type:complete
MGKLTALSVKSAKIPGRYQDGGGLMLVVKASGSRSWILRIQVNGKRRDFGLGSVTSVSLADAREKAAETRKLYQTGINPIVAKKKALEANITVPTFSDAARKVFAEHESGWRNARHINQWKSSLKRYASPFIGALPVDEIEGPDIIKLLLPIWLEKPETARRVKQRIGVVLDWSYANGYRKSEAPMRSIGRGLPKQVKNDNHFKAMPYDEVPAFIAKLDAEESISRLALKFLILGAARTGEVREAKWEEIDFKRKLWTIPASRMKARKEHIVPLGESALEVLERMKIMRKGKVDEHVFPGMRPGKPFSEMMLLKVLRSMGIVDATVHGFRSSFRDWAAEQTEYAGDVVEAALAHTIRNRVEAAYRRTNYLDKRKQLMADWSMFMGC